MSYISYNKLWESEFDGIVSKRDKLQDLNINQLKLEVHDTYKKEEKLTTNFEAVDDEDVINKSYLDSKLLKIDGHLSKIEKDYIEFKLQYNKQNIEEILFQRALKTTIQILYDKGLFDNYANADKVLEVFLFTTRRREDLSVQVYIKIQQVLSSLSLKVVGIYLRDGPFSKDVGIVNLHPSKGTHWVLYIKENYFDSYGCTPPQKLSNFNKKRNGYCLYSEYKIQGLTNKRDSYCAIYCLYILYITKVVVIAFKSAFPYLYNQRFS